MDKPMTDTKNQQWEIKQIDESELDNYLKEYWEPFSAFTEYHSHYDGRTVTQFTKTIYFIKRPKVEPNE